MIPPRQVIAGYEITRSAWHAAVSLAYDPLTGDSDDSRAKLYIHMMSIGARRQGRWRSIIHVEVAISRRGYCPELHKDSRFATPTPAATTVSGPFVVPHPTATTAAAMYRTGSGPAPLWEDQP